MPEKEIKYLPSPHLNQRPNHQPIDLIVLHTISLPDGEFSMQYISDFFLGKLNTTAHPNLKELKSIQVSAHFVVARNGIITQFVPTEKRAWHAGESAWLGREDCNDYSIGIEMVGDERTPFTPKQYTETARLCRSLMQRYPNMDKTRIVGHQDIAPNRKWDPGKQWNWRRFRRSLAHIQKTYASFK